MSTLNGGFIGLFIYAALLIWKPHITLAVTVIALAFIGALSLLFR